MTLTSQKLSVDQGHARANWYVVATKTREEEKARVHLERQGYSVFFAKSQLKKKTQRPLAGGHRIFVSGLFICRARAW